MNSRTIYVGVSRRARVVDVAAFRAECLARVRARHVRLADRQDRLPLWDGEEGIQGE